MENVLPKSGWTLYTARLLISSIHYPNFLGRHTFVFCFYADVMSTKKPAYLAIAQIFIYEHLQM